MRRRIELGLLYSRTGSYALLSEACRNGAMAAIEAVNADPSYDLSFVPVERDPGGNIDLYGPLCAEILRDTGARHVIGCVTSWSRKEVIPVLEKLGGTLWYAVPYEGFEASDHIAYTHACPNQHLLPLLDWAMATYGRRVYLTGSNYIWGWEINRLAREIIAAAGGEVLGERYLPIDSTDADRILSEIRAVRPDFVLNSLIGRSFAHFVREYHALGAVDSLFAPGACPVMSCSLAEAELPPIGAAAEGVVSAGPYFRDVGGQFANSAEEAAHKAVMELARLLNGRTGTERLNLRDLLAAAPAGIIDPETHHTTLPVLIAQVRDGAFRVVHREQAVPGDPYLAHTRTGGLRPRLRVVS